MILSSLHLTNFKNIGECALDFSPKINCFLGDNGVGKSNLLDAIHYLSFCKSFAGLSDPMLIRRGEDFAIVRGHYLRRGVDEEIVAGLSVGRRKSFKRSGKEYRRLSEHIGLFPLVMVAPADIELINGSGEVRRRFLDMVISQGDARYLEALIRYNQALTQRNSMLRDGVGDANLYLAVEMQMEMSAEYIYRTRDERIERLSEIFGRYYSAISGTRETPRLIYRSHLSEGQSFSDLLNAARERDRILRHTSVGVHRDDIEMTLDDMPARQTAELSLRQRSGRTLYRHPRLHLSLPLSGYHSVQYFAGTGNGRTHLCHECVQSADPPWIRILGCSRLWHYRLSLGDPCQPADSDDSVPTVSSPFSAEVKIISPESML